MNVCIAITDAEWLDDEQYTTIRKKNNKKHKDSDMNKE